MSGALFIVAAPSGAGKSSLVKALLETMPGMRLSVSYTTRAPRPGEEDGREYHFVDVETFSRMRVADAFLEFAEVHGNFYGTSRSFIEEALAGGEDVMLEIDWQGAEQVMARFAEVTSIFILPPSIDALVERLNRRGQDSEAVIARRVAAASGELSHAPEFEYVIINQDFPVALRELSAIVLATRLRYASQALRHADVFAKLGL